MDFFITVHAGILRLILFLDAGKTKNDFTIGTFLWIIDNEGTDEASEKLFSLLSVFRKYFFNGKNLRFFFNLRKEEFVFFHCPFNILSGNFAIFFSSSIYWIILKLLYVSLFYLIWFVSWFERFHFNFKIIIIYLSFFLL